MVSTVKSRPNHYEVLGLEPTATTDEIGQAFGREISIFRPHTLNEIADVTVAYETLRNPAKRRAYDASLSPKPPKPEPGPLPTSLWKPSPYLVRAAALPAEPLVEPRPQPNVLAETPAAPETTPIGAALRELAGPKPLHDAVPAPTSQPQVPNRPEAGGEPNADPPPSVERKGHLMLDDGPGEAEEGMIPWNRVGIAAGGLLAVVLVGGWAGWESGNDMPQQAQREEVLALPPPTTFTVTDPAAAAPAPVPVLDEARPAPAKPPARAVTRVARARPTSQLADLEQQLAELPEAGTAPASDAGQVAEAPAVTAVPASMPLPNAVIARTIARIGYACGQVESTTALEPGVFKVTCTSGHSYRASPVRGRYRFRRLTG